MLESEGKKDKASLGKRIILVFLIALSVLIFVAYYVLSENFHSLLVDYTTELMKSMANLGATTIEAELRSRKEDVMALAESFSVPADNKHEVDFPEFLHSDILRIVYVSDGVSISSDGRQRDINKRQDIIEALNGSVSIYGPYFNEENEYVICYSAPVYQNNSICGALSVERDGYSLSELIRSINFGASGESYIINSEGTDIAVSQPEHIDWVKTQYNAEKLLEQNEDVVTRSVFELEQKGLNGESGTGTYYWNDGLCYLVYIPIPSTGWVLLTGLREAEIAFMTKSTLYSSFTGPTLSVCIGVFLLLTVTVIYWIFSSMKKSNRINEKLNIIANYDPLTGAKNRYSYHAAIDMLSNQRHNSLACIYIDVNGLHEINNRIGHQAGDDMLKTVVNVIQYFFSLSDVYRIGGDEFVVFCRNLDKQDIYSKAERAREKLQKQGYEISIGIDWKDKEININNMAYNAEKAMQNDKYQFYKKKGNERQIRTLDRKLEQMLLEKQDADTFLSVLAPDFKGVYFVNLDSDTIRHLYIPSYFEEMLEQSDYIFSKALSLYIKHMVSLEYQYDFQKFCDYRYLESQLKKNSFIEFKYQKTNDLWLSLRILKFKTYKNCNKETLWIFSNTDAD